MSEKVRELSGKDFEDFVKEGKAIVDFWAPWCGPCKMMGPEFEAAAQEGVEGVKFGKVNVDENQELAQKYGVMSIPTLVSFDEGKPTENYSGALKKDDILKKAQGI